MSSNEGELPERRRLHVHSHAGGVGRSTGHIPQLITATSSARQKIRELAGRRVLFFAIFPVGDLHSSG